MSSLTDKLSVRSSSARTASPTKPRPRSSLSSGACVRTPAQRPTRAEAESPVQAPNPRAGTAKHYVLMAAQKGPSVQAGGFFFICPEFLPQKQILRREARH
jgi:hypothetical protein